MNDTPDIAVAYKEHLQPDLFNEFGKEVEDEGLAVIVESRPDEGAYACPEWFMLTAVAVFIGKSYFDGFLKEAGKDHYHKLKSSLARLTNKVMKSPRIEPVLVGTPGKINSKTPYTLAFSIYAEANDGNRFKLLLPRPIDTEDYTEIVYKFLEFLNAFHSGIKVLGDIGFDDNIIPPGRHIFVHMNNKTKQIEWLDDRNS